MRRPRPEPFQCKLCPKVVSERYIGHLGERSKAYNVCHSCDGWLTILGYVCMGYVDCDDNRILVIEGDVYVVKPNEPERESSDRSKGFGGQRRSYVLFDDPTETVLVSNNTWMLGEVPKHFRALIEDNARYGDKFTLPPYKFEGMTGL